MTIKAIVTKTLSFRSALLLLGFSLILVESIEISNASGWHPWGFTSNQAANVFVDLTGRIQNLDTLQSLGNIYLPFKFLAFTYPPTAIPFFWPLRLLPYQLDLLAWTLLSILSLVYVQWKSLRLTLFRENSKALLVAVWSSAVLILIVPAIYQCIALGQLGLMLLALVVKDYFGETSRRQGLYLGIATAIKIYPVIFIFSWLTRKKFKQAFTAIGVVLSLLIISAILWPRSTAYYFQTIIGKGQEMSHLLSGPKIYSNSSVISPLIRPPLEHFFSNKALILIVLAGFVMGMLHLSRRLFQIGLWFCSFYALATASAVGSFITWDHYLVFVVLLPIVIMELGVMTLPGVVTWSVSMAYLVPWWRFRYLEVHGIGQIALMAVSRNALLFATLAVVTSFVLALKFHLPADEHYLENK
jgi:alpha-1,2-mannosyltransferase